MSLKKLPSSKQSKYQNQVILNNRVYFDNTSNKQCSSLEDILTLGVLYALKNNALANIVIFIVVGASSYILTQ